ncbi:methyltransferase [Saccharopolyspora erythraea]|uniref:methyltransferase n=1 Tax=Saccharopolyspora erythraea TaxID=1836 RepID=UPI001BA5AA38|nr:methyltransferase [Saccharopolyspora erythraea]QUH01945.1 methyltransferase [Saccharopolyspora erythraea]
MNAPRPSPQPVTDLMWAQWKTKLLVSALETGVFTALAGGSLPEEALRERAGVHPRTSRDFFDALVALGLLRRDGTGYANTAESAEYLRSDRPATYLGDSVLQQCAGLADDLTGVLRTGVSSLDVNTGTEFYDTTYASPESVRAFQRDMTVLSIGSALAMAEKFPWQDYKTVADIGCAEGALPGHLLRRHPHLHAIGFDLPVAEHGFLEYTGRLGVGDRVSFAGGDFFADPMPSADVLVLGHILHNWDERRKLELLSSAHAALPEGGAVIVYETLIDDGRSENAVGLILSLIMHMEVPGGYDYTGADCQEWLRRTGFRGTYVEHLDGPESMVVGFK